MCAMRRRCAFAAAAERQLTGRLTCCAGSCGPGNLDLINGLYDAHRSMVPMVALASHIPSSETGTDYFQETHPTHLFQECSHYVQFMPKEPKVVQVDLRRERLGSRSRLDLGIWGDVKETLDALLPRVAEKTDRSFLDGMLARHGRLATRIRAYADDVRSSRPIHPEHVAATLDELAADDAVFTIDNTLVSAWSTLPVLASMVGNSCMRFQKNGTSR